LLLVHSKHSVMGSCIQGHVMGFKMGLSVQYSVSHSDALLLSGDLG